jgi:hypothetical protein
MDLLERWECRTCGRSDARPFSSHTKTGDLIAYCHGPVLRVEYVRAVTDRGAVDPPARWTLWRSRLDGSMFIDGDKSVDKSLMRPAEWERIEVVPAPTQGAV